MGAEALRSIEIQSSSSQNKENVIAISETVSLQKPTTAIDSVQVNMKLVEEAQPTNSKSTKLESYYNLKQYNHYNSNTYKKPQYPLVNL